MRCPPQLILAFLVLAARPAFAQVPSPGSGGRPFGTDTEPPPGAQPTGPVVVMRLAFAGTEGCPAEQVFRDAVGAHVRGWAPFAPNAPWRLTVSVTRGASGYEGSAELRDVTGAAPWSRAFPPTARCVGLLEDLALAVALHVDPPQGLPRPPSPALPATSPVRVEPVPDAGPAPAPERALLGLRVGAMAWMDLATAPRPAVGVTVDVGYRVGWFSIAAELRGDPPAGSTVMDGVGLSTTRIAGALVPCGHVGERVAFVGCLVGEVGQLQGTVTAMNLAPPDHQAGLSAAAGVRLGIEIPLARHLYARGAVDLMGALARPRFLLDQSVIWESPAFLGGLGLGLVAPF
jgi:hypothetical protein